MAQPKLSYYPAVEQAPDEVSDIEILKFIEDENIDWESINELKEIGNITDELIANWFNVSLKTLRTYRAKQKDLNQNFKERVLLILVLLKRGLEVFGTPEDFRAWLHSSNFLLNQRTPLSYLDTITGIRFINSRLIAMEYGDNA